MGFTTLYADAPGISYRYRPEPGEVVQAGRMIVQLARRDGRDAVFEVPESVLRGSVPEAPITVTLNGDPTATVKGRVREVSPQADPVTRTFRVRVGLTNPGEAFRLGAAVTGSISPEDIGEVAIPASAIVGTGADAAVWVVEPKTKTVTLRKLLVLRSDPAKAIIGKGLEAGDLVVTAGARQLRQGQPVRLIGVEIVMRLNLSDWALRHRSLVTYLMIVSVAAGLLAYFRLGRSEDPSSSSRPWWCLGGVARRDDGRYASSKSPSGSNGS